MTSKTLLASNVNLDKKNYSNWYLLHPNKEIIRRPTFYPKYKTVLSRDILLFYDLKTYIIKSNRQAEQTVCMDFQ